LSLLLSQHGWGASQKHASKNCGFELDSESHSCAPFVPEAENLVRLAAGGFAYFSSVVIYGLAPAEEGSQGASRM
jgi:hypothetical protein